MNKETIKHEKERICTAHGLPNCCPQFKHNEEKIEELAYSFEDKYTSREFNDSWCVNVSEVQMNLIKSHVVKLMKEYAEHYFELGTRMAPNAKLTNSNTDQFSPQAPTVEEKCKCIKCTDLTARNGKVCCRWCCKEDHDHIECTDSSRCHCDCHKSTPPRSEATRESVANNPVQNEWAEDFAMRFVPTIKIGESEPIPDWGKVLDGTTANYMTLFSYIKDLLSKVRAERTNEVIESIKAKFRDYHQNPCGEGCKIERINDDGSVSIASVEDIISAINKLN